MAGRTAKARHLEQQRRYRERMRKKATPTPEGVVAPRGAPESRAVIQALASAVRVLAAEVRANPKSTKAAPRVYGELLGHALDILVGGGYDRDESFERLSFYSLPDKQKSRRRKADIERRYWERPPVAGVPRVTNSDS